MTKRMKEFDPKSWDLCLFAARHRKREKALLWDGTGLCPYAKRLKNGRFANLWASEETTILDAGGRKKPPGRTPRRLCKVSANRETVPS
jgi:hypothetical protein